MGYDMMKSLSLPSSKRTEGDFLITLSSQEGPRLWEVTDRIRGGILITTLINVDGIQE